MSAQSNGLPTRATAEQIATLLAGFPKLSKQRQEILLKLAFDHVIEECRDVMLLYIQAATESDAS